MPTGGGQQDLPGGGHRGLPAVGHVLTLPNRPGEATARQRRHPPAHRGRSGATHPGDPAMSTVAGSRGRRELHRRMAIGFVMDVGTLAVAVEDHDEFGRAVDGCEGVRRHGAELGGLAGLDEDLAFAER